MAFLARLFWSRCPLWYMLLVVETNVKGFNKHIFSLIFLRIFVKAALRFLSFANWTITNKTCQNIPRKLIMYHAIILIIALFKNTLKKHQNGLVLWFVSFTLDKQSSTTSLVLHILKVYTGQFCVNQFFKISKQTQA